MLRPVRWLPIALVAAGIVAAGAACSSDDGGSTSTTRTSTPSGASIFATNCATCHGADGGARDLIQLQGLRQSVITSHDGDDETDPERGK